MAFNLENRYVVIKIAKLNDFQKEHLARALEAIDIPTVDGLVIEKDWPEYQPTLNALAARVRREQGPDDSDYGHDGVNGGVLG